MTSVTHTPERSLGAAIASGAVPWVLAAGLLMILPMIFSANSALTIMNQMAITIVFALAYNMLLGQTGLLSFGLYGHGRVHVHAYDELD